MSLSGLHRVHGSMSSDFSSKLSLADMIQEYNDKEQQKQNQNTEQTPLLTATNGNGTYTNGTTTSSPRGKGVISDSNTNNKPELTITLIITIFVVTIGSSFQFGYGTGIMNNSEGFIISDFNNRLHEDYTLVEWSTTVSCYGIGGLLGAIIGPKILGQYFGRRYTLLINNIFLFLSSIFIAYAPKWYYQAIGRIFIGIVAGVATAVVPTYFSEISPIALRGAIGTMHQLGITVGILISQTLSTPSLHLLGSEEKWQWLFLVPVICGIIEIIVLPFCPESPSYLYTQYGEKQARQALVRLQNENVADQYLSYIKEEVESSNTNGNNDNSNNNGGTYTVKQLFNDITLRKQLFVGITVQLMMQFSGIDAVFYYSTTVFYQANVSDPELATTLLGIINVIITIIAVKYMDTAGRKTLLTYSWIGMLISYLILTFSFICKPYINYMDQVSVFAMTGVIIFFAFGPGCIAWFIIAEIFPLYARDTAMAVGIFINWIANWLVAFCFPILLQYTQPYTFLIFVSTTSYFLYFTRRYVPETKGLTISQVTYEFEQIDIPLSCCGCKSSKRHQPVELTV